MSRGIVYCLTNPAMPELVKIGLVVNAEASSLKTRMSALYSTGVPVPFEVHYAVAVDKPAEVERLLHSAFHDFRENPGREFFRVEPERVVAAMKLTAGEEVSVEDTPDAEISQADIEARKRSRRRRDKRLSNFRFSSAHVPFGEEIEFIRDPSLTAKVLNDKRIEFEGKEHSLTSAARLILKRTGETNSNRGGVAGPTFWQYQGETLSQRRRRKNPSDFED